MSQNVPAPRLVTEIPLHGLVTGSHLRLADINKDGKPEVVVAQSSRRVAKELGLTRLTCLTALDLNGNTLWQAGMPESALTPPSVPEAADSAWRMADLPFQLHDVDADGNLEVICVFGYDVQIRDSKRGKVLWSTGTPGTQPVGRDFKELTADYGAPWGDESLNMDVASIQLCNTQGRTVAREMLLKDDFHHLALIDAEPIGSTTLLQHRGNHGRLPWVGDIDGDGQHEILAGAALLDGEGKSRWSHPLATWPRATAVVNWNGSGLKIFMALGDDGVWVFDTSGKRVAKLDIPAESIAIGRFLPNSTEPALAVLGAEQGKSAAHFGVFDAHLKPVTRKTFPARGRLDLLRWASADKDLLMLNPLPGSHDSYTDAEKKLHGSLWNAAGEQVLANPFPNSEAKAARVWVAADGRECLLTWNAEVLRVYAPQDAGDVKIVPPTTPPRVSMYQAAVR